MNLPSLLIIVANFGAAAGLLWLGGATASAAALRGDVLRPANGLLGAALGAAALWWPGHVLRVVEPSATARALLAASALAALATLAGRAWAGRRHRRALLLGVTLPPAAYFYAMFAVPGLFRGGLEPAWLGAGMLSLCLPLALVAVQREPAGWRFASAARVLAAAAAAALVVFGAVVSAPAGPAPAAPVPTEWLLLAAFSAISALLLATLRHAVALPQTQVKFARSAAIDNLTGLPTRLYFEHKLGTATRNCDTKGSQLAVLFIDLDGFKPVNDSFGHSSGDRVLEQVGARLKALARGVGVSARVGGDEFLLLAIDVSAPEKVAQLAERVIEELSRPYQVDEREVTIACSAGVALYPGKCEANKLIACADAAMYAAKRAGGSRHCFYAPEMDADVQQNFDMLRDMRHALTHDEFELFFQPKIDARSGKVTAAEALLRWNHPTRGFVMPTEFVPLAERSGLIGPLGNWVIEAACKQARAWRDKGLRMRVAINLSACQMRQDDIADRIADALTRHRIHPSLLTCEITESAAMEDTAATQETFRRLGELGAHLSIDDFGTGYSSLSYLRRLPAEELKIDASFVHDLDHGSDARAVVDAVIKLAHALGLKVVAEGVENLRQHKMLVELGCDELQGFLFAKPMTARALLLWAMDDRSSATAFRDSLFGETRQTTRQFSPAPPSPAGRSRLRRVS